MFGTILAIAAIVVLGTRLRDGVRLEAERIILERLPLPEAHAYYQVLKRRVWRVKTLRALVMVALVLVLFAVRQRFFPASAHPPAPRVDAPSTLL